MEAPTRKIIRKNNKVYYMLEDNSGVPSQEEQQKYRSIIQDENLAYYAVKQNNKSDEIKQLEASIRQTKDN